MEGFKKHVVNFATDPTATPGSNEFEIHYEEKLGKDI